MKIKKFKDLWKSIQKSIYMKINFSANLETIWKSKKISQEELADSIRNNRQVYIKII